MIRIRKYKIQRKIIKKSLVFKKNKMMKRYYLTKNFDKNWLKSWQCNVCESWTYEKLCL